MKNRIPLASLAVTLALGMGLIGCGGEDVPEIAEYDLTISSTEGGSVTTPGERTGSFTFDEGTVVDLVAEPEGGYRFVNWSGDIGEIADSEDATTSITVKADCSITANFAVKQCGLITTSTEGGSVTTPGENSYTYDRGEVVHLAALADEGYQFISWTGDVATVADVNSASTTIIIDGDYSVTVKFAGEIRDWYDLHAIRDNLDGTYILMNNLDSNTPGYEELAGPTANQGKGWEPIGNAAEWFAGGFDGQGYEIRGFAVNRPDQDYVGLFGRLDSGVVIQDVGVAAATVTGSGWVGGLAGYSKGTVSSSYAACAVSGEYVVGGVVGINDGGMVSNSYSAGSITGSNFVGGLVGWNFAATLRNSYSRCRVTGESNVGALAGLFINGVNTHHCLFDMETTGLGGPVTWARTTAEMKNIATFSEAGWDITAVAPSERNTAYTWNIVDGDTYPFLSWQSVS